VVITPEANCVSTTIWFKLWSTAVICPISYVVPATEKLPEVVVGV
jgi:hypothetical protein